MSLDKASPEKQSSPFKRMKFNEYGDVPLSGATLYDLVERFGQDGQLDYTSANGNRIISEGTQSAASMKRTRIGFSGSNNTIQLGRLIGIARLDIACIGASTVKLGRSDIVRGATIMASHRATIEVGLGCMFSRDIMLYASGAHGLYNSADGKRRGSSSIKIADRVWIGQGARVLSGARVGPGSVIGSYSVLAGKIPNNCAAAGNPCRVTSRDIFWTTESIEGNYFIHMEKAGKSIPFFAKMTELTD